MYGGASVKDSRLLMLSLLISTLGLGLLFYLSTIYSNPYVKISQIDYDSVGERVTVEGEILRARNHPNGHIFLKLGDSTGNISIVFFSSLAEKLDMEIRGCLHQGGNIRVTGRVEEYRGSLEVIPRKGGDVKCLKHSP
jgi:hypothetical protein